jgi:hypothetical protein
MEEILMIIKRRETIGELLEYKSGLSPLNMTVLHDKE